MEFSTEEIITNIIFEDDWLIVLNKPEGLLSIPAGIYPNLLSILKQSYKTVLPVHRLDRDTSGAILFAKSELAHKEMNLLFQNRLISKKYSAVTIGNFKENSFIVEAPLSINRGRKNRTIIDFENGKPASTEITVLKQTGTLSLLDAKPNTGYRHQIRAHCYYLDSPIIGDSLYYSKISKAVENSCSIPVTRLYLHAREISFIHPFSNQELSITAPFPDSFQQMVNYFFK